MSTPTTPNPTPVVAHQPTLTDPQRAKLEWLVEVGHKAALMVNSPFIPLKILGTSLVGRMIDEYNAAFAEQRVADAAAAATRQIEAQKEMDQKGPALWKELHQRALRYLPSAAAAASEILWLNAFPLSIPCGACKVFYNQWKEINPAPLANPNPLAYFGWTVDMHNAVNLKLGKPNMTAGQAQAKWQ